MNAERERCAEALHALARWAVCIELPDIPPEVVRKGARVLADDLAAMVGARDEPEVVRFHRLVLSRERPREATVWRGGNGKTDRISAAVANAVAADWLELDEGYRLTPCHAGLYVIPSLLAEAEASPRSYAEMLRALVLGYEIVTRVARAWTPLAPTMQSHGRYCAIGAAAATGLVSRLDAATLVDALSAAATLIGPSPRNHLVEGALVRNVWPAAGAWSGMMAVEWADCGISGTSGGLYDVYSTILGGKSNPERLSEDLGTGWALLDGYTKIYACCQHLHSAVEAAIDLRQHHPEVAAIADIDSIGVETHGLALPLVNANPHTTLGAKFSMPHAVASALATGAAGAAAFSADSLKDPRIAALRARVSTGAWLPIMPPPDDRPARVTVRLRDGRAFSAECMSARGGPDRPLPEDAWVEKMHTLASPVYPAMVEVFSDLVQADARRLAQPWPEIVTEIVNSRSRPVSSPRSFL